MDILCFTFRGKEYLVDRKGRINANGIGHFSDDWIFLGGTHHHSSNYLDVNLIHAFNKPKSLNACLGWDCDHGTVRRWGGLYNGKLPRITNAHVLKKGTVT